MRKASVFFLALCISASVCALPVFAGQGTLETAKPSVISVTWQHPSALLGVDKGDQALVLRTSVAGREVKLSLSFPQEGGVRLRSEQSGFFDPKSVNNIQYTDDGNGTLRLKAGGSQALLHQGSSPWSIEFLNAAGKTVHTVSADQISFGYQGATLKKVMLAGSIGKNEVLYGLGERFNAFNQVGSQVLLWNTDGYDDLLSYKGDKTVGYKNVPILYSSTGYSLFFNSYYAATADIGKTDSSQYTLDFNGPKFDFYLWTGTPLQNIQSYTALTGTSVVPPKWAFEYMVGAGGQVWDAKGEGKDLEVLTDVMNGYAKLGTPVAALLGERSPSEAAGAYQHLKKPNTRMLVW